MGDPESSPLDSRHLPSGEHVHAALGSLILSASGWRKVFADPREDEGWAEWVRRSDRTPEQSLSTRVSAENLVIAGTMAYVYGLWLIAKTGKKNPSCLVGMDTRPTGPVLGDMTIRVLEGMGLRPGYIFTVAAPEIMALDKRGAALPEDHPERTDGFVYISASHNPPGHNGFKFGAGTGGVLSPAEIAPLIKSFREEIANPAIPALVASLADSVPARRVSELFVGSVLWKRRSISAYTLFSREIFTGLEDGDEQERFFDRMMPRTEEEGVGVVADMNGSARSLSIDGDFLSGLGVKTRFINHVPGMFAHRIVPEASSLDDCRKELEVARVTDGRFLVGYVPDCDGDRGNLVWYDDDMGCAKALEAQEVFSLCCVSELAALARIQDEDKNSRGKLAIVVNDATSLRIEWIARKFGAKVFRAETGEANVVGLAARLRSEGWTVRILGEGSNGGNITHPSRVRDPLATLGAVLKLLAIRDREGEEGLFHAWLRLSGGDEELAEHFTLSDILASLPAWATTSVFEDKAALKVESSDRAALKSSWYSIFMHDWNVRKQELADRYGIAGWRILLSSGMEEKEVMNSATCSSGSCETETIIFPAAGGVRLVFIDSTGESVAMLWMRASGTEPVFRILADIAGGTARDEAWLLDWQKSMVTEADSGIARGA